MALLLCGFFLLANARSDTPEEWRREKRIIDLHMHLGGGKGGLDRAVRIMDRVGLGVGVNLSGGTVTHEPDKPSAFQRTKELADSLYPNRFIHYMNLDYRGWDNPDFSEKAVQQIENGFRMGAAGLKEYKRLGLNLRNRAGELIKIDDPKLDPVWAKCGELSLPVSIHVADPRAFWQPFDETNERWKELKDHKGWWFGDPSKYPPREELLEALDRVIARHPKTTFVCLHFANNAEDLDWVDRKLSQRPNMYADLAARIPELGRHDPEKVRQLFTRHADRILFATDFMVYDRLILGSGGDDERPTDDDAVVFFQKCYRWLETADRNWAHMTPIQGDWTISSINLPPATLRKIYFDNAVRLLARSLPAPVMLARHTSTDFVPDGKFSEPAWGDATPVRLEYQSANATSRPELSTTVRALWTDQFLYLGYECPYTQLTVFNPPQETERIGLWDRDVVEAFIGTDMMPNRYTEYEWAPNGERLDLKLDLPERDFEWSSGMESAISVDEATKIWRVEVRIPMKALAETPPQSGTKWRINLFRQDKANKAALAFRPTLRGTFHTPERFAWLLLGE